VRPDLTPQVARPIPDRPRLTSRLRDFTFRE
jgi:hypothetical protein